MQKYPNEYYSAHKIFPPENGEECSMYFKRLFDHFKSNPIIASYRFVGVRFRYLHELVSNLENQEILNMLTKYNRNYLWSLIELISMYHVFDHYPDFLEHSGSFCVNNHYNLLKSYKDDQILVQKSDIIPSSHKPMIISL